MKALGELQNRGQQAGVIYDNILLETTGLADPAPVAFTFFSNTWISSNYRLDSILCLVDAQHVASHLEDAGAHGSDVNEAVNQIAFADIILLNKLDLVSPEQLQKARDLVRSINVTADLIEVQLSGDGAPALPCWDRLMGINSFSIERALKVDPYFMDSDSEGEEEDAVEVAEKPSKRQKSSSAVEEPTTTGEDQSVTTTTTTTTTTTATPGVDAEQHQQPDEEDEEAEKPTTTTTTATAATAAANDDDAENPDAENLDAELTALIDKQKAEELSGSAQRQPKRRRKRLHDVSGVGSVGITARGPLDKYRFNAFMRDLLSERARDIFRSKGVLSIKGQESTKFVFQGVHETVCFGPAASGWREGEVPLNQIVFIGRNLNRKDLLEGLRSCVWVPLPDGWTEHFDSRTHQPYYVDAVTGRKQWDRPEGACALVTATETSHRQPSAMQPRHGASSEVIAK